MFSYVNFFYLLYVLFDHVIPYIYLVCISLDLLVLQEEE